MAETTDYTQTLSEALKRRADWLERSELPKLKEELRAYHTGFASLYNLYVKKRLIHEDPYKQEAKIGELEVPDSSAFSDATRVDELTLRLSAYDNQLDFLVNFYQFSADFLDLERIKRIVGLVKYVDWIHLIPDSQSPVTRAVAEMTNQIKTGTDSLTMSVIGESLANLNKSYAPIMNFLKTLTDYRRELYKLELREMVTGPMSHAEAAQLPLIRKKFAHINPGKPFYPDLAEEVIKEDSPSEGRALREKVLKSLEVADDKPKNAKAPVSFKSILMDGIAIAGSTAPAFLDISAKVEENKTILESKKQGLWQKLKIVLAKMLNKEPEPVVYQVEYVDAARGVPVTEKINYNSFKSDMDRKLKTLAALNGRGPAFAKLNNMQDEQLISFLERTIRDIQSLHKVLSALDEFFKAEVDRSDREKVKGIKPELATIKNAIVRANSKRHEYSAQKEEEEQLKRLGVSAEQ